MNRAVAMWLYSQQMNVNAWALLQKKEKMITPYQIKHGDNQQANCS